MIIKGFLSLAFIVVFVSITSAQIGYFWALVSVFLIFFMLRSMKQTRKR